MTYFLFVNVLPQLGEQLLPGLWAVELHHGALNSLLLMGAGILNILADLNLIPSPPALK